MRYRRLIIPGTILVDRINQFKIAFNKVKLRHPFKTDALVILPDHLHIIMTLPKEDSDYSLRVNLIKSNFSRADPKDETISGSRKKKRERGVWQRRFWEHVIRDGDDYERHVNYIHNNPVKHGYVKNPTDWQYSTIHRDRVGEAKK